MKLRKIIASFSLLLIMFFLVGCINFGKVRGIIKVENVLAKFGEYTDVDMDYSIVIKTGELDINTKSKVIRKEVDGLPNVFMQIGGESAPKLYYIDKYLCFNQYSTYEVSENYDFFESYNVPTDLKFDFNSFELSQEVQDENIIYTITVDDADVESLVESILNETLYEVTYKLILTLTVDKITEELRVMDIFIKIFKGSEVDRITLNMKINSVGEDVILEIPDRVYREIQNWVSKNGKDPYPIEVSYNNTTDGVVKYFDLGLYKDVVYDKKTNKIIVLKENSIEIYNSRTLLLEYILTSESIPTTIDADNGRLVIGYMDKHLKIYDLLTLEFEVVKTEVVVSELVVNDDVVIYVSDWGKVIFYNLVSKTIFKQFGDYRYPMLTINREDDIVYLTENKVSRVYFIYFSTENGEFLYSTEYYPSDYSVDRIKYDGKYVHYLDRVFNRYNGTTVTYSYLNRLYRRLVGFQPKETLYENDKISIVSSADSQNKIGIYNNQEDKFIYDFSLDHNKIIPMKNGFFLGTTKSSSYVALFDLNKLNSELVDIDDKEFKLNEVVESTDGLYKTLHSYKYTKTITLDNYIYALNQSTKSLNIYDINTLSLTKSIKLVNEPVSFDTDGEKIVIGFGNLKEFWIYDISTWDYTVVKTLKDASSTIIYKDKVYYTDNYQYSDIYYYNLNTKEHIKTTLTGEYISMAINRKDGVLYYADLFDSVPYLTYYDLDKMEIIKQQKFYFSTNKPIYFDGSFVHFAGYTFDTAGEMLSGTNQSRHYNGYNDMRDIKTIYDNQYISVFTGIFNDEYYTIIYDLHTEAEIYSFKIRAVDAYIEENKVIIYDNNEKIILFTVE